METEIFSITLISIFIVGIALGYIAAMLFGKTSKKRLMSSADNDTSLENEVLKEEVKQLEAKISTLEKALELSIEP